MAGSHAAGGGLTMAGSASPEQAAMPNRMTWARRATVVSPRARVDVALPVQSTFAELVPELVRLSDAQRHVGPGHTGWVLTRLGGAPLPAELTIAGSGLRDGDVLYLVPRERQGAPLLFDDVVDAIASASENSDGAWRPSTAHRVGVAGGAVALAGATGLLFALLSGKVAAPAAVGGALVVLLAVGGLLARVQHDRRAAIACVAAGLPAALLTGVSAVPPHKLWPLHGGAAALGLAVLAAYSGLAIVTVKHYSAWFGALAGAAVLGGGTAAVVGMAHTTAAHAGVVLAVFATALAAGAPMLSMRLGRLPLPRVPSDITAFRENEEPTLGPDVLHQTTTAQRMLTGLLAALGLSAVAGAVSALRAPGTWPVVFVSLLSVVWMLRSRSYTDTIQRVLLVGSGLTALTWLAGSLVVRHEKPLLLAGVSVLALAGLGCFVYARHAGQGRHSPYWTRFMDVSEFLSVVALLPIAGVALGVYEHLGHIKH
ncbi:type VII secretion integral membrane protein EccD [Catenulispora pinisilvae]|uniref:type VII secretion integral membrane protein EccD n=1 Tax=Catenulispora pinisilvae TaxID=2705253 RepID=UPI0018915FA9|nr:type VII secretion integral membrane protein EccD [Catenulispora pinisilvae]